MRHPQRLGKCEMPMISMDKCALYAVAFVWSIPPCRSHDVRGAHCMRPRRSGPSICVPQPRLGFNASVAQSARRTIVYYVGACNAPLVKGDPSRYGTSTFPGSIQSRRNNTT